MARFRCPSCGEEGTTVYDPNDHACPVCGSVHVQFSVVIGELSDDHAIFEAMGCIDGAPDENEED